MEGPRGGGCEGQGSSGKLGACTAESRQEKSPRQGPGRQAGRAAGAWLSRDLGVTPCGRAAQERWTQRRAAQAQSINTAGACGGVSGKSKFKWGRVLQGELGVLRSLHHSTGSKRRDKGSALGVVGDLAAAITARTETPNAWSPQSAPARPTKDLQASTPLKGLRELPDSDGDWARIPSVSSIHRGPQDPGGCISGH